MSAGQRGNEGTGSDCVECGSVGLTTVGMLEENDLAAILDGRIDEVSHVLVARQAASRWSGHSVSPVSDM